MELDSRVTDPTALLQTVVHEIGHTYGLADCSCSRSSSVMGPAPESLSVPGQPQWNDTTSPEEPLTCDREQAKTAANSDVSQQQQIGSIATSGGGPGPRAEESCTEYWLDLVTYRYYDGAWHEVDRQHIGTVCL
jgi:hypothetical protein